MRSGDAGQVRGAEVELRDVTRVHRNAGQTLRALDGVNLRIAAGSIVALCGPSASGKSSLLHVVGALDRPDEGDVLIDGTSLRGLSERGLAAHRRRVGFVFQGFNLLPALTARDNVLAPTLPVKVPFDRRARAAELLAAVGLAGRGDAVPSELSGGQQQRVAIARALVNRPQLLLADEPTGSLDSATGDEVLSLLIELRERSGTTLLVATHDESVAARCDRILTLSDGRVVDDVLLSAPDVDDVRRRLGRATGR